MPPIQIKCPVTERLVNTGIAVDSLDTATMENNAFSPCPECQGAHVWSIRDGTLEVE